MGKHKYAPVAQRITRISPRRAALYMALKAEGMSRTAFLNMGLAELVTATRRIEAAGGIHVPDVAPARF